MIIFSTCYNAVVAVVVQITQLESASQHGHLIEMSFDCFAVRHGSL
jgi:hypothetical protein